MLCRVERLRESEGWREGPLERKTTVYRPLGPFVNTADLLCGLSVVVNSRHSLTTHLLDNTH